MSLLERFRHKKRGTVYEVLGTAEIQLSTAVSAECTEGDRIIVYRGETGKIWARFIDEFHDGRFERLPRGRLWWPQHFCDEGMPGGTRLPQDWITGRLGGDSFVLGPDNRDERMDHGCITAALGEIVEFAWCEDRGSATVVVNDDGTWLGTEPEDYSHAWEDGESESCGDSIDEVVRCNLDFFPLEAGDSREITLRFCKWGDATLRLVLDANEEPAFVPADGGQ